MDPHVPNQLDADLDAALEHASATLNVLSSQASDNGASVSSSRVPSETIISGASLRTLFTALRQSAPPTARRTLCDALKAILHKGCEAQSGLNVSADEELAKLLLDAASHGPNDGRRLALQALSALLTQERDIIPQQLAPENVLPALANTIQRCLRAPPTSLSAVRTAAAALRALHGLIGPKLPAEPSQIASGSVEAVGVTGTKASMARQLTPSEVYLCIDLVLATTFWGISSPAGAGAPSASATYPQPRSSRAEMQKSGALSFGVSHRRNVSGTRDWIRSSTSSNSVADGEQGTSRGLRSRGSVSSLRSTEGGSVRSDAGTTSPSGAETEEGELGIGGREEKKLSDATRVVRQNAVSCVSALTERNPKALYPHWTRLFPGSPSAPIGLGRTANRSLFTLVEHDPAISVRIAAAHALESVLRDAKAYLSVAEERPARLAAFTSLSARLATLIVDLRTRLIAVLSPKASHTAHPTALLDAVLKLTRTLVLNTADVRLRMPHLEALRAPVLRLCSSQGASLHKPFDSSPTHVLAAALHCTASYPEPSLAVTAYSTLSVLIATSQTTDQKDGTAKNRLLAGHEADGAALRGLLAQLQSEHTPAEVRAQGWGTLATFAESGIADLRPHETSIMALLDNTFSTADVEIRQAAATFFVASLRGKANALSSVQIAAASSTPTPPTPDAAEDQRTVLSKLLVCLSTDNSVTIRALAGDAMPLWASLEVGFNAAASSSQTEDPERIARSPRTMLDPLLRDPESAVRASSVRALGVMIADVQLQTGLESPNPTSSDRAHEYVAAQLLGHEAFPAVKDKQVSLTEGRSPRSLYDPILLVRMRASWTLANLCEAIFEGDPPSALTAASSSTSASASASSPSNADALPMLWLALLRASHKASSDDERVSVHALRAAGVLLGSARRSFIDPRGGNGNEEVRATIQRLCAVLAKAKGPKLRWNAATSLGKVMGSSFSSRGDLGAASDTHEDDDDNHKDVIIDSLLRGEIISALSSALHDKTFKVKLCASQALLLPPLSSASAYGPASVLVGLRSDVKVARENIEGQISEATFQENRMHGKPCKDALEALERRLSALGK